MGKMKYLIIIILIAGIYGCKNDSDVLATYKDSKITRGDFYNWLELKRYTKKSILKSKAKQKNMLKKMATELFTIKKAKQDGFDKDPKFELVKNRISEGILMKKLYDKEIKDKATFKEPAAKVRQILLRVRNFEIDPKQRNKRIKLTKEQLDKKYDEIIVKAKDIIEKLNNGESFEGLAKQYSEDFSKKKGGDIGFVVPDMVPAELADVIFSLKKGEYTKEPVKTSRGVYIVKVEEQEEITEKNIDDIIENKSQASRLKSGMLRNSAKEFVDKLMNADDVKYYEDKILSDNSEEIIFKVGDKNYTVTDLNKKIESRRSRGRLKKTKINIKDTDKKRMAKSYFQFEVLKRDALNKGIDKDPEYIKEMRSRTNPVLASEYLNSILAKDIEVTDKEIKAEYNKNKEKKYYRMVNKGKKRIKQIKPFKDVKESIERSLVNRKRSEKKKNWENNLFVEYAFKIDESELESDK